MNILSLDTPPCWQEIAELAYRVRWLHPAMQAKINERLTWERSPEFYLGMMTALHRTEQARMELGYFHGHQVKVAFLEMLAKEVLRVCS